MESWAAATVGTTCSTTPEAGSRSSRTRPVVAFAGTATRIAPFATSRVSGLTVVSPRLPEESIVVNTTRSSATMPGAENTMYWPTLALAMPALVGVPLSAARGVPTPDTVDDRRVTSSVKLPTPGLPVALPETCGS